MILIDVLYKGVEVCYTVVETTLRLCLVAFVKVKKHDNEEKRRVNGQSRKIH